MMRIARPLAIAAAIFLASCSNPAAPDPRVIGSFDLVAINGIPVPEPPPYGKISATVTFRGDWQFERRTLYHGPTQGTVELSVQTGYWRIRASSIEVASTIGRERHRDWYQLAELNDENHITVFQLLPADGYDQELYQRR